uniref:Uncharacterized protein n=1 Tax=Anopheles epiroticus TaxID=199890 RepID=A0A182PTP5_9DIPT
MPGRYLKHQLQRAWPYKILQVDNFGIMVWQGVYNRTFGKNNNRNADREKLWLDFSMDGLPLHNSGPTQLWPILMRIYEMPSAPIFVVALFCGSSKPSSANEYLDKLVTELNTLQSTGMQLNGNLIAIGVRAILADTPARSFIKGVTGHTGHDSCQKCTERTMYDQLNRRIYFNGDDAPKRNDADFKAGKYDTHYKHSTPLVELQNFNIINDIPTTDRLHLIDLGVMKGLMKAWKKGKFGRPFKLDCVEIAYISSVIDSVKLPSEIPRKLRDIRHLNFWKGAEYKNFLHYPSI